MTYQNATENWLVVPDNDKGDYYIGVREPDGTVRPHTSGQRFEEEDEAFEYIEAMHERFEEEYDNYLEENRHAIVQSERYEMWRNEQ